MALLWIDGFDLQDFAKRYTLGTAPVVTATTRFSSGYALDLSQGSARSIDFPVSASSAVYVGAAMFNTNNASLGELLSFWGDAGVTQHVTLGRVSSTHIEVKRGATQLATYAHAPSGWFHLQMYATIHDTTGSVTVKIDGVSVITLTNADTRNGGTATTIDKIRIGNGTGGRPYVDDLWVSDSAFMGDCRVQTLSPDGAGTTTQWTPTSGTNFSCVNDASEASFVASATSTNRDTYAMGALAGSTITVYAAQVVTHGSKSDAGAITYKNAFRSNGVLAYGSTISPAAGSFAAYTTIRETDPDTTAAWTVAAVNALEAGAEVI